eukprot:GFYU01045371.1.p1 GENE.GFYU01045371.1~~GFYU01045371.1.p1  ORF type:complete len:347 (-),score=59.51 GFYU01045371.1:19-990(-)
MQRMLARSVHTTGPSRAAQAMATGSRRYSQRAYTSSVPTRLGAVGLTGMSRVVSLPAYQQPWCPHTQAPASLRCRTYSTSSGSDAGTLADTELTLYQFETCPYCTKTRTFMDFNDIQYNKVDVHPISKKESVVGKKVPVLMMDGVPQTESNDIIKRLQSQLENDGRSKFETQTEAQQEDTEKWLTWVDNKLLPLFPPNTYGSYGEGYQLFTKIVQTYPKFSPLERMLYQVTGPIMMKVVSGKIQKRRGIVKPREELYQSVNEWLDAVQQTPGPFYGGEKPSLVDVVVYGGLKTIAELKTFDDVRANTNVDVWWNAMSTTANNQ